MLNYLCEQEKLIRLNNGHYISLRAMGMLKRVSVTEPILFAGGVARNLCMCRLLEDALKKNVLVPEDPQMVGALGAALLAGKIR